MSLIEGFFHGADTELGIFYPRNYLLAVFKDWAAATKAAEIVLAHGFSPEHVVATPGQDVVRHAAEHFDHDGTAGFLMRALSRLIGTEAVYADRDLEMAAKGAAFLAVYCPTEAQKRKAWEAIQGCSPVAARHYALTGIEHLAGEV